MVVGNREGGQEFLKGQLFHLLFHLDWEVLFDESCDGVRCVGGGTQPYRPLG